VPLTEGIADRVVVPVAEPVAGGDAPKDSDGVLERVAVPEGDFVVSALGAGVAVSVPLPDCVGVPETLPNGVIDGERVFVPVGVG